MPATHADLCEVAIVGCGGVSHSHGEALLQARDVARLVAACDIEPDRAAAYADEYGDVDTATYTDYEEMIAEVNPEIVLLATWPNQHEEQVLHCVNAGVPGVLCEKSLSLTGDSAARMARAANGADIDLLEGFMYRHNPRTLRFFEMAEEGAIGDLRKIRAGFSSTVDDEENWRRDPDRGGGVIFDFTCYCINAITAAAGGVPERVAAEWDRREDGLIESLYATMRFSDTLVAQVETSQNASFSRPLELHGDEASIRLNPAWGGDRNEVVRVTGDKREHIEVPVATAKEEQLRHLIKRVRGDAEPRVPIESSVRNHYVIDACLESAERGTYVSPQIPEEFLA